MNKLPIKNLVKNFTSVEVKEVANQPRTLVVKISTSDPDRYGDTVDPKGMDSVNFMLNPVVLFAHNYQGLPIAKCLSLQASGNAVLATVQFPEEGVSQMADTVYNMCKQGFLNAWSIGFISEDYDKNESGGYDIKKWELLEFSCVPVPANPKAVTVMKSLGVDVEAFIQKDVSIQEQKEEEKSDEPELPKEEEKEEPQKSFKKDVDEVVALSYVLDILSYFIQGFQNNGVSAEAISKLQQALELVLEVTRMEAVLGQKDLKIKSGRSVSAKHEKMLKDASDHMTKAMESVAGVLDSITSEDDENGDEGKGFDVTTLKSLRKAFRETDKSIGLTLRSLNLALSVEGGEK